MSLSDQLTLDGSTGTDFVYNMLFRGATETRRIETGSTPSEPNVLSIKHSTVGQNGTAIDRHLVQLSRTKLSSAGLPRVAIVNFTIAVPRDTVITQTIVLDLVGNLVDLIADGGWTSSGFAGTTALAALLRGES